MRAAGSNASLHQANFKKKKHTKQRKEQRTKQKQHKFGLRAPAKYDYECIIRARNVYLFWFFIVFGHDALLQIKRKSMAIERFSATVEVISLFPLQWDRRVC